jgi:hypothetical protein
MDTVRSLSARRELRAAAALLIIAGFGTALALAVVAPLTAGALATAGALVALGMALAAPAQTRKPYAAPLPEQAQQLRLTLPDGSTLSARAVALPGESDSQLLLTREGYLVVDADGRPLHRL